MKKILITPIILILGCAPIDGNGPYYGNSGYGNNSGYGYDRPYYGNGYDQGYNDRKERQRLERERDRIEEERERLEEERRRRERDRDHTSSRPIPPPVVQERCPSGFSPSENKCSHEERRRGCQDMRLPGGLGCVKR